MATSARPALPLDLANASDTVDLREAGEMVPFTGAADGLSPAHLKKAKLMFFFTRYPSASLLQAYYPDVKFTRCITSQLIKWFSNFREFFYIQMERFGRQAVSEGLTNSNQLSLALSRDSELFRSLNMHYNKANDFKVPDRFLEVAGIALREFFEAIVRERDGDPSWKKNIYKLICKLDTDVPDMFKSPNFLQQIACD